MKYFLRNNIGKIIYVHMSDVSMWCWYISRRFQEGPFHLGQFEAQSFRLEVTSKLARGI
jgi:hypothetical protein